MHIHILGICGTFMAGIALLAKQQGHQVTGCDTNVYPPMSTQLETQGITCYSGYKETHLKPLPDQIIIGNALSRGNPMVEFILNHKLPYISGPQWLAEQILRKHWVIAVSGTHGKTTTSSMTAWILEYAGLSPSFLIGGVPENFGISARLSDRRHFVIEADEYDTAFFDKRSKFIHYSPNTLIINNLEFDHADIFPNLAAIQQQFHHLVRIIPNQGLIIHNPQSSIHQVLEKGCWTATQTFNDEQSDWQTKLLAKDASQFEVFYQGQLKGKVSWTLIGQHNVDNALAAIAASHHVGVKISLACEALKHFRSVKRRLELRGTVNKIKVYDDFAHHPTAIQATLQALRQQVGVAKIIAVLEPRSNTMRMGVHQHELVEALSLANEVCLYQPPNLDWSLQSIVSQLKNAQLFFDTTHLIEHLIQSTYSGDHILIMSNGDFENIHQRLLEQLNA